MNGLNLYRANVLPRLLRPEERRTDVPVLAVSPDGDAFVTTPLQTDIARWAPNLSVQVIRGGHWLPRNDPGLVARLTLRTHPEGGRLAGMRTLLNLIWLVLAGFWLALGYLAAGILCCILIITIPFGIASFRIAGFALWPFGRTMVDKRGAGAGSVIGNVIWVVVAGWWLALGHLVSGIALCLTVIGIPLGLANFKLIPISLLPLGKDIVSTDEAFGAR